MRYHLRRERAPVSRWPAPPLGNVIVTIQYDEIEGLGPDEDDTSGQRHGVEFNPLGSEDERTHVAETLMQ
jgi:hypothetical protein